MIKLHVEWDEQKNAINQQKHGVAFEEAQTVFLDEGARRKADPEHSQQEKRYLLLGQSNEGRILMISHCYRESNSTLRIISARLAGKKERAIYEEFLK